MADDDLLTIGELGRRTGVATSALRYYDELGLLRPAVRVSGHRRYAPDAVGVVGAVLFLRDVGFTLDEIRSLMAARAESPRSWRELARPQDRRARRPHRGSPSRTCGRRARARVSAR
jgi:DNA-binding transcriptional MerR regulator